MGKGIMIFAIVCGIIIACLFIPQTHALIQNGFDWSVLIGVQNFKTWLAQSLLPELNPLQWVANWNKPRDYGMISGANAVADLKACKVKDMWGYGAIGDIRGPINMDFKNGDHATVDGANYDLITHASSTSCNDIPGVLLGVP